MSPPAAWSFPPFRLDPVTCSLWRDDVLVPLPPKPLAVLAVLVAQAGQVVSKEALLDTVWSDTAVTEGVLKGCISQIRRVLGEAGMQARYIATVHGRGYRFSAPVTLVLAPAEVLAPEGPSAPPGSILPMPFRAGTPLLMVGREAELAQVHQWWAQARQGTRQVVFVTGEAGIGKTTLVDAFVAQVAPTAPVWIGRGQCLEQHGAGEPYLPLLEALSRLGRGADGQQLVAVLRQQAPSWLLQLPALMPEDAYEALQRRGGGVTRARMLRELAEAVEALTATRPVVLVLEDLHWSDGATVDWLAYVARRQEAARLLVLGTYRLTEAVVQGHAVHKTAQELQLHSQGHELGLEYFPEAAVAAYLARRLGTPQQPAGLVRALHQRTTGNPLFLTTVVDMLVRQGQLQEGGTSGEGGGDLAVRMGDVPDSLRQFIEQQLTQLSPDVQAVLEAASVAGKEFAVAAVAAAVAQAVEAVEDHCGALARQGQFLRACGTDIWPDGTVAERFGFLHDLYRETLYGRVPVGRRVRWHRQIGRRLEAGYGPQARELAAELAEHFVRGRDPERAVPYLRYAGESALQRGAAREAVIRFEQALAVVQQLPQRRDIIEQGIDLRLDLRYALHPLGEREWGFAYLCEAETLAQALGDQRRLAWISSYMTHYFWLMGDLDRAVAAGQRARTAATGLGDFGPQVTTNCYLGQVYCNLGEYRQAMDVLRENLTALKGSQRYERFGLSGLLSVISRYALARCLAEVGAFTEGIVHAEEGVHIAETVDQPYSRIIAYVALSFLSLRQGDFQRAIPMLERSLRLCQVENLPVLFSSIAYNLGMAYALAERSAEALPLLEQAVSRRQMTYYSHGMACLGEAYRLAGRMEDAMGCAQRALDLSQERKERGYQAWALRLLGEIAIHGDPPDIAQAKTHYQHALALAEELGMRPLMAHCHLGLGKVYSQMAQREQTHAELSTAIMLYRTLQMPFWCSQAEAARAQVPGQ
jgi:DNA-binding winged helix-turn-helix (wHTH) protein/tetratricopeptide (TPR) repeat protein